MSRHFDSDGAAGVSGSKRCGGDDAGGVADAAVWGVVMRATHVTNHTSHVTRHTSHVTRHASRTSDCNTLAALGVASERD